MKGCLSGVGIDKEKCLELARSITRYRLAPSWLELAGF